jgi:ATP-dependent DNA ligase
MTLPTLYHKGSKGELRQWRTWTEGPHIFTEHGIVGGKLQLSRKTATPKNVGRSNETTADEQALSESQSLHTHKLDRKYSETPEEAQETLPLPMLAHSFANTKGALTSKAKKIVYPAHTQPKLDGVRCLATRDEDGEVRLTSRAGKPYNLPHIELQLNWMPTDMTLDGEIYIHGMSCQKITSWVKKWRPDESDQLVYHVYDMPVLQGDDSLPWKEREDALTRFLEHSQNVAQVYSRPVETEEDVWNWHGQFIAEGYEGAILRGLDGIYRWGHRSSELLKVKRFQDEEFVVVDAKDGEGKMEGCVIWICKNDLTDETFECSMKATMDERRRMYAQRDSYFGKKLTVRFFDRTDAQKPRFPVGVVFRDTKDLG